MSTKSTIFLFICFTIIIVGMVAVSKKVLNGNREIVVPNRNVYSSDSTPSDASSEQAIISSTTPKKIRISETGSMSEHPDNSYWWLNSGAYAYITGSIIQTVTGELPKDDPRRIRYARQNPGETDNGYHPQNIFRLVTRAKYQELMQQVYFKISQYHTSSNVHRAASNGILLFNRYLDGDNLYYTGVRVDGTAVIKKKIYGTYYTMAIAPLFPGIYDRTVTPNLLPMDQWVGIKSEVHTLDNGTVSIKLFVDQQDNGNWKQVLEAIDDNNRYGGGAIKGEGYAGIRSDFMDVSFDRYLIKGAL